MSIRTLAVIRIGLLILFLVTLWRAITQMLNG